MNEVLGMSKYPKRALGAAAAATWIVCTMISFCGPLSAAAADRSVLCEEFTNSY
jgi:hypothetical protein